MAHFFLFTVHHNHRSGESVKSYSLLILMILWLCIGCILKGFYALSFTYARLFTSMCFVRAIEL